MREMARRTDRKHVIQDGMVALPSLTCVRSFRLSRATRTWNHLQFWHRGVLRTRRPTPFCLRFRAFVAHSDGGNLRRLPMVRAPDQQQQGTIRLKKSPCFLQQRRSPCTLHEGNKHGRGHLLNPCVGTRSRFTTSDSVLAASAII